MTGLRVKRHLVTGPPRPETDAGVSWEIKSVPVGRDAVPAGPNHTPHGGRLRGQSADG